MNTRVYICIASVTIETVLLYNNYIMYEALATDAILVETWTLGRYDIRIKHTCLQDLVFYMSYTALVPIQPLNVHTEGKQLIPCVWPIYYQ